MSEEWLDIQSFWDDQKILKAINDLSISKKQELAGIQDKERSDRADEAENLLGKFLQRLNNLIEMYKKNVLTGVDTRTKELVDAFVLARQDTANYTSTLMKVGPEKALNLLHATDARSKRDLINSLAELRKVVSLHQQKNVSAIFEEF